MNRKWILGLLLCCGVTAQFAFGQSFGTGDILGRKISTYTYPTKLDSAKMLIGYPDTTNMTDTTLMLPLGSDSLTVFCSPDPDTIGMNIVKFVLYPNSGGTDIDWSVYNYTPNVAALLGFYIDSRSKTDSTSNSDTTWIMVGADTLAAYIVHHIGGSAGDGPNDSTTVIFPWVAP